MTSDHIMPTRERIRHAGDRYVNPCIDRSTCRPYGRVSSWHEVMCNKRTITPEQAMAARELEMLCYGANRPHGACTSGYGDRAPRSTPMQHMSDNQLLAPEWRATCHNRLNAARSRVSPRSWAALMYAVANDADTKTIGYYLGSTSASSAYRTGGTAIRDGLHALAVHWQFTQLFHAR